MKRGDPGAQVRRRMAIARLALVVAFLALAARAAHLSLWDSRGEALGARQLATTISLAPERGAIFDRNGHELALSVKAPSVYVAPAALGDRADTARQLARALGRNRARIAARLEGRRSFAFVARWVSAEQAAAVEVLGLPGVGIVQEPLRTYPTAGLAAQLVGFANIDGEGVRGIEQSEDSWLRGTPLQLPVERDGSGRLLVDRGDEHWGTAGGDVALTLDVSMQSEAALALEDALASTGARAGVVVTLDPHTGDVLALAEAPSFDPNRFRELDFAQTRSRAFLDALEPGSTLKAFLVAAVLRHGVFGPEDIIDCEQGEFRVPGKTIRDRRAFGPLSPGEILRVSSNIGAVKLAYALGPKPHVEMLRSFGFGAPTGSGFPEESAGLLREIPPNRPVDHATLAFGQGTGVTAIQLAAATASFANGGEWVQPRLISRRRRPGRAWQGAAPAERRRVLEPQTAASVLAMLESVTQTGGTGRRAALRGVRVAGKTGTAQKWDAAAGEYSQDRFVAWFIGVAPADDPKVVVVAALDEPRRPLHTGGSAAAPLFARVAAGHLVHFGILTQPEPAPGAAPPDVQVAEAPAVEPAPAVAPAVPVRETPKVMRLLDRLLLPDLEGLTIAQVKAVSAEAELSVEISGEGWAVAQEPPPGTIIADEARIIVRFARGADPI